VKDGITYVWEMEPHKHTQKSLFKVRLPSNPPAPPPNTPLSVPLPTITSPPLVPVLIPPTQVIHADSDSKKKIEIARFSQPTASNKDGVLVLDSREIDALLGILTVCAMLEVRDSFAI
jgi:hypothetical protein